MTTATQHEMSQKFGENSETEYFNEERNILTLGSHVPFVVNSMYSIQRKTKKKV